MNEALTIYGPLGLAVAGLSIAVVHLYRDNKSLYAKRETDVQALMAIVAASTQAANRHADMLESFTERLPKWLRGNGR